MNPFERIHQEYYPEKDSANFVGWECGGQYYIYQPLQRALTVFVPMNRNTVQYNPICHEFMYAGKTVVHTNFEDVK